MSDTEDLSITLPTELARLVRAEVATGSYVSDSALIGAALRRWYEGEAGRRQRLQRIAVSIDEALNDPRPSRSDADVARGLEALHAATLKARSDAA